jgi:hypothetical protein
MTCFNVLFKYLPGKTEKAQNTSAWIDMNLEPTESKRHANNYTMKFSDINKDGT